MNLAIMCCITKLRNDRTGSLTELLSADNYALIVFHAGMIYYPVRQCGVVKSAHACKVGNGTHGRSLRCLEYIHVQCIDEFD